MQANNENNCELKNEKLFVFGDDINYLPSEDSEDDFFNQCYTKSAKFFIQCYTESVKQFLKSTKCKYANFTQDFETANDFARECVIMNSHYDVDYYLENFNKYMRECLAC